MAEHTKEDLAQEVAYCYVGYKRADIDDYKSGNKQYLNVVIGDLVRTVDINKMLQLGAYNMNKTLLSFCSLTFVKLLFCLWLNFTYQYKKN